jgi:hypothetical protein
MIVGSEDLWAAFSSNIYDQLVIDYKTSCGISYFLRGNLPCPSTCGQSFRLSPELPLFHRQLVSNVIFVDVGTTPEACRYLAAAMGLT